MLTRKLLIGSFTGSLILAAPLRFDAARLAQGSMPLVSNTACADGGCGYDPIERCGVINNSRRWF